MAIPVASLRTRESGATLVETAILLPIWFGALFFVMWMAYMSAARQSLVAATQRAVELAITRANVDEWGKLVATGNSPSDKQIIEDVRNFSVVRLSSLMLRSPPKRSTTLTLSNYNPTDTGTGWCNKNATDAEGQTYPGCTALNQANPVYIYALIYMNEAMRLSMGSSVYYPCNPAGDAPNDGPGCLSCTIAAPVPKGQRVSSLLMTCAYQPETFLMRPMISMLRALRGWGSGTTLPLLIFTSAGFHQADIGSSS